MLNVAHVTNDVKWRLIVTTFGTLIENMGRTGLLIGHTKRCLQKNIENFIYLSFVI